MRLSLGVTQFRNNDADAFHCLQIRVDFWGVLYPGDTSITNLARTYPQTTVRELEYLHPLLIRLKALKWLK